LQLRDVDHDLLGDVRRQTLDPQLAGDDVEHAALHLDADGHALDLDVDVDLERLVEGDLVEVRVEQPALDGLDLELLEDDLAAAAAEVEVEQRVLPRGAAQDGADLLRGDGHRHRLLLGPVQDAGDQALRAQAPVDV